MISEGLISSFYNFKGNSFYSDTNFLALVIQNFALVCFFLYKKFNDKKYFRNYVQLMFFSLLTLSRSVVLTQIMLLLFDFYYSKFKKGQFAKFFLLTMIFHNGNDICFTNDIAKAMIFCYCKMIEGNIISL